MTRYHQAVIISVILLFPLFAIAEIDFSMRTLIDDDIGNVVSIFPIDDDNDTDYDFYVVHLSDNDNTFSLYRYEDGLYPVTIFSENTLPIKIVDIVDIDDDNDLDILLLEYDYYWNNILVLKNSGDIFTAERTILYGHFDKVQAIDIDLDEDLDICYVSYDEIGYNENNNGTISEEFIVVFDGISTEINGNGALFFDNENDGDFDLLTNDSQWSPHFIYCENNGDLEFESSIVSVEYNADRPEIRLFDIDSDSDLDFMSSGYLTSGSDLSWWENEDNDYVQRDISDQNWEFQVNVFDAADFDSDGDLDLLSDEVDGNGITLWENDGEENFNPYTGLNGYYSAKQSFILDYDNDGDLDILLSFNEVYLCTNRLPSSVNEPEISFTFEILSVYPNPFNASANVSIVTQKEGNLEVSLYNLLGQKVATITNQNYSPGKHYFSLNGTDLNSGSYFIQAKSSSGNVQSQKITILK